MEIVGGLNLLGPIGIPALPPKPEFGAPVAPTRAGPVTSGSDGSEDDDPDELGQNVAPGDLKRVKRCLFHYYTLYLRTNYLMHFCCAVAESLCGAMDFKSLHALFCTCSQKLYQFSRTQ